MSKKKRILLIASLGQRDVQFLLTFDKTTERYELPKKNMRDIHKVLKDNIDTLKFYEGDVVIVNRDKEKENREIDPHDIDETDSTFNFKDDEAIYNFEIYPGLLMDTFSYILTNNTEFELCGGLFLNTDRSNFKGNKSEPFAAGPILSKYCEKKFGFKNIGEVKLKDDQRIDIAGKLTENEEIAGKEGKVKKTGYYNILIDAELFSSCPSEENHKYYNRILKLIKSLNIDDVDGIVISTTGGIPLMNEVIRSGAIQVFGNEKEVWQAEKDEFGDKRNFKFINIRDITNPVVFINAKAHAVNLIKKGDFVAAADAMKTIDTPGNTHENKPKGITYLEQVANYFKGYFTEHNVMKELADIIGNDHPDSLHIAMLCESALRQGDYINAIIHTTSFLDAVIIDLISKLDFIESVQKAGPYAFFKPGINPIDIGLEKYKNHDGDTNLVYNGEKLFIRKDCFPPNKYKINTNYKIEFSELIKICNNWSSRNSLELNRETLYRKKENFLDIPGINSIANIRNLYIHNARQILTEQHIETIKEYLYGESVWVKRDRHISFLDAYIIKDILSKLGVENPIELYEKMKKKLLEQLKNSEIE